MVNLFLRYSEIKTAWRETMGLIPGIKLPLVDDLAKEVTDGVTKLASNTISDVFGGVLKNIPLVGDDLKKVTDLIKTEEGQMLLKALTTGGKSIPDDVAAILKEKTGLNIPGVDV
jgi:hypothetical protein